MPDWKKTFALIWAGQFFSLVTSALVNFAIILWMSIQTESAEVLAIAAICAMLPQSVIGLFAGVLIDKWDRKRTMIFADAGIALSTLFISILLSQGEADFRLVYLLLAVRSVGSAFHMPAMQASIPLIAPRDQLLRISGINQVIFSTSTIAGPALGALFIGIMSIEYVLLIDVTGAAIAIVSLLFVNIPNPEKAQTDQQSILSDFKAGFKVISQTRGMTPLMLASVIVTILIMPLAVMFPLLTLKHFKGNEIQMSLIEIAWGVGMLAGGALLGLIKIRYNRARMISWTYVILGIMMTGSGILPMNAFSIFVLFTIIGGSVMAVYSACFNTIIQEKTDPAALGRVFSIFTSFSILPSLLGLLGIGFLSDGIGITTTFISLGAAITLTGIISFLSPSITAIGTPANTERNNS